MNKIRITAVRQTIYHDLIDKYGNPIEHTCDVREGQQWISVDGQCPEGMCLSAWSSMREFVESLAKDIDSKRIINHILRNFLYGVDAPIPCGLFAPVIRATLSLSP
jgi:uncharacterized repeat protein (TIGR04076 family)